MFGFKEVDPAGLQTMAADGALVIDVRTDAEVARGMIGGAQHLPLHMLPVRESELPKDKPIIIYCQSGGRSAQACAFLSSKGFTDVYNLQGGIMGWVRAGQSVV